MVLKLIESKTASQNIMIIKTGKKVTNLAKTPLRPAPRTSVVRGPADLRLKYENALYVTFDRKPNEPELV